MRAPTIRSLACFLLAILVLFSSHISAAAADEKPAGDAYRLQPGDEVSINVAPQKTYDANGIILPDGKLFLRGTGGVQAAGLTLEELSEKVRAVLATKLVEPRVVASISRLAPKPDAPKLSVTLTGAVKQTGEVTLPPGTRIQKALDLQGGAVPTADLTRVVILHKDLTRTTIDLSTPERRSDPAHNRVLQDGDSVEIAVAPVLGATVIGAVTKPGGQTLTPGLKVREALDAAGGVAREADLTRVSLRGKDQKIRIIDLSTPEALADPDRNVALRDGDVVEVPLRTPEQMRTLQVRIAGEVQNPGPYPYKQGMTLDDLIVAAGKLGPGADLEQIQVKRGSEPLRTVDLFQQQKLGLSGKVELNAEDEIFVPARQNSVLFIGAVGAPGSFGIKPGQTLGRLLSSGDPALAAMLDASRADLKSAEVIRPGEERKKINLIEAIRKPGDEKKDFVLKPGDLVYLPPRKTGNGNGFVDVLRSLPIVSLFGFL